jgi:hypothetical protein
MGRVCLQARSRSDRQPMPCMPSSTLPPRICIESATCRGAYSSPRAHVGGGASTAAGGRGPRDGRHASDRPWARVGRQQRSRCTYACWIAVGWARSGSRGRRFRPVSLRPPCVRACMHLHCAMCSHVCLSSSVNDEAGRPVSSSSPVPNDVSAAEDERLGCLVTLN